MAAAETEAGEGFDVEINRVSIIDKKGIVKETETLPKREIASLTLDVLRDRLLFSPPKKRF